MFYTLSPAGYLIVEGSGGIRVWGDQRYLGVDRQPPFIAPDPEVRELIGAPPVDDDRLREALDEWFDFAACPTAFIPSDATATRLMTELRSTGIPLELLFCELASCAGDEGRIHVYLPLQDDRPRSAAICGFDVSWPSCRHSAIRQPGVVRGNRTWESRLNEWGLLDDFTTALALRDEYLRVYPYPPFDILRVHWVREGSGNDMD